MDKIQHRLAAILCADVKDYSRHMGQSEEVTFRLLNECRTIIDGLISSHGGRIANTAGDSVVAEFGSVGDAVTCAVNIQEKIGEKMAGRKEDEKLAYRIGINLGDIIVKGNDILGDGVNVAARLEGIADVGGINISGSVYDCVKNKLPYQFKSLGEKQLKNIAEPMRVYQVLFGTDKAHRNSLRPGHKLLWYRIDRVLGQGGFGITYLAYDDNLKQQVAIKEYLPAELAVREQDQSVHPVMDTDGEKFKWGLDRFISEAQTLAKFKHPNIVRVASVFTANNTGYMVMEYEKGESLQEILTRRKTVEEAELLKILLPILDGLEQVHAKGFIHRDIKPANIFIREDGSPVLLDFGSARQALGEQTKTLTSLVSPGYAPFEQYYSKGQEQGPWTDIYGLGATLYRAVTGRPPMDAIDRSKTILETKNDVFVSAMEVCRGRYSERFLKAIDHALKFRQKERPQNIAEWRLEFGVTTKQLAAVVAAEAAAETVAAADTQPARVAPQRKAYRAELIALIVAMVAAVGWYYRMELERVLHPPASTAPAPVPPAAPPVQVEEKSKSSEIADLLAKAKTDIEALRLIGADSNNAIARYKKVLQLDPQNSEAQQGIRAIADKFVSLAMNATAAANFDQAGKYLDEATAISPDAPNIKLARDDLNLKKAAQTRAEAEAKAAKEKQKAVLQEADAAIARGDVPAALIKLEQARTLGADAATVAALRDKLRTRITELAAAATAEAKKALQSGDTAAARAALQRARDLKAQADTLAAP
ncbi:MAG TPA: protein kinase [Gammaproteobacteria bacterium]|nr:protein kinase [Gammaproteobacteria bacterium]